MRIGRGFFFLATVVVACGGTSSGGGGGTYVSQDAFATSFCNYYLPCCQKVGKTGDSSTCTEIFGSRGDYEQYNPTYGTKCLDEVHAAQSKPTFCDMTDADTPSCGSVYSENGSATGTKAPGEPCESTEDCAASGEGSSSCRSFFSNNAETRICQVRVDGKAGDTPCVGTKDGSSTSFSGMQTNPPAKGYVCDVANGIACNSKSLACEKIPGPGDACGTDLQYQCVKSAFCDFTNKKCVARLAAGGDCSTNSQACALDTYCDQTSRKCTAILADGAPCSSFQQCGRNASCTNGVCKSFGGTGSINLSFVCTSN